ncbi:MAG: hypothetical protein ABI068_02530 [Ktedonobacterales bacterium]
MSELIVATSERIIESLRVAYDPELDINIVALGHSRRSISLKEYV